MISTWITSLYVSQPSSVVFECKTAHFGPELQVFKTLGLELQVSAGEETPSMVSACKTATSGPE